MRGAFRMLPFVAVALVASAFALCQGCGDEEPRHLFVQPDKIDFGRVLYGDTLIETVLLRNGGDQTVYVTTATTNCACFQLRPFNRLLRPGEERRLEISLVSSALGKPERPRGKKLDLRSDDAQAPQIAVPLEADIVRPCSILPPQIHFRRGEDGTAPAPRRVEVRPGPGLGLELVVWRVKPKERVAAEVQEVEGGVDFVVSVADAQGGEGPLLAALSFRLRIGGNGFETRTLDFRVDISGD